MKIKYSLLAIITLDVIISILMFAPWDEFRDIIAIIGLCIIAFWVNIICGVIAFFWSKTERLGICFFINSIIAPIAFFVQAIISDDRNNFNTYGPKIEYTFTQGDWGYMLQFFERDSIFVFGEGDFRDPRNTHWNSTEGKYTVSSDKAFHFSVMGKECVLRNDTLINFYSTPVALSKDNALLKFKDR